MGGWTRRAVAAAIVATGAAVAVAPAVPARAGSASEIDARVNLALDALLRDSATARAVNDRAVAVLVFPDVVKAGLGLGGQYGQGALRRYGVTSGYYNIASASVGLQAGAQSYAQFIFFMTEDALRYLDRSKGFEIGADANVAVIEEGKAVDVSSTTLRDPIVAFAVGQKGLMAGATIEGSKITRINPRP